MASARRGLGSLTLTRDSKLLLRRMFIRTRPEYLRDVIETSMRRSSKLIAAGIVKEYLSGQRLHRRTGALARSITGDVVRVNSLPGWRIGSLRGPSEAYASVQEFGTQGKNPTSPHKTIRPKRAKALAVPVGKALTKAGVRRYASPRDYPRPLRFIPFRRSGAAVGALYEADQLDRAAKLGRSIRRLRAVYILMKQVDLPARFYLNDGLRQLLPIGIRQLELLLTHLFDPGRITGRVFDR